MFTRWLLQQRSGAPCVWRGLLSLALCKPKIRKSAGKGALVFGFGGKSYGERLLYVAQITSKPETGEYYQKREFADGQTAFIAASPGNFKGKQTLVTTINQTSGNAMWV